MEKNENWNLKAIVSPLLTWYETGKRVLPWREEPTPYRVWISEIMLQQTRVEAGKPYFERFVAALPTISSLAAAPEEQLLKLWEGLGYYNRVRNLQKAAQVVMQQYGGELPADPVLLQKLPGIGAYTAGAISSIAFGLAAPAVDGNVLRVWSRLTDSWEDIGLPAVKRGVEQQLLAVYPQNRAGDFTQALMELGALVCVPNGEPKCGQCPLHLLCQGNTLGIAEQLPVKAEKKARRIEQRTVLLAVCGGKAALCKRPETGLLAGLWEFPTVSAPLTEEQAKKALEERGLPPLALRQLPRAKHIFSHVEWKMNAFWAEISKQNEQFAWASPEDLEHAYALPSALRTYLKIFMSQQGTLP